MRLPRFSAPVWMLISSLSCLPPGQDPTPLEDTAGEQVEAATPTSAVTPEGTQCHSGTFECADGPNMAPCGTWYFDINESDVMVGTGQITGWLPNAPVTVTLTGTVDPTNRTIEITLTSLEDGSGAMHLSYVGPTLELVGDWTFTNGPEPEGIEIGGVLAGASCVPIP